MHKNENSAHRKLRQVRLNARIRLQEVADAVGKSASYVSAIEQGRKAIPSEDYIRAICSLAGQPEIAAEILEARYVETGAAPLSLEDNGQKKELALALARRWESISPEQVRYFLKNLTEDTNDTK